MIVDVDTHWESTRFARGDHPLEGFQDRLPDGMGRLANALAGDLLAALPEHRRPSAPDLLAHLSERFATTDGPPSIHPPHDSDAADRVAWMDRIGVDFAFVNPGGYWQLLEFLGPDRPRAVSRANAYLADALSDHLDRLSPVAIVDLADLDVAVAEMTRMRERGSRAFFLYSVLGRPPGGISPGHPAWDRVWAAAVDLGMVAVVHVGNTAADFGGWADIGWDEPGGAGLGGLLRLANTQRIHVCEMFLHALVLGGVFARHPRLTVLLEEMRVGWLDWFIGRSDGLTQPSPALGPWPYDETGGQQLRRHVKVTPLPGFGDRDALDVLARHPEMLVFSSDFPHAEGNADPLGLYRPALDALDADLRAAFLGATMRDCFARMGDPLPLG